MTTTSLHLLRSALALALLQGATGAAGAQTAPPASPAPVTRFEYDAEGNPTKTTRAPDSLALSDQLRYDRLARAFQHLDPSLGITDFTYKGSTEHLAAVTDPRRLVTGYLSNGLQGRTQTASPDRGTETQVFDAAGNLQLATDALQAEAKHSYDALDRLTRTEWWARSALPLGGGGILNKVAEASFSYDQTGPEHGHGVGRLTTETFPRGNRRYSYDARGRLTRSRQFVEHNGHSHVAVTEYQYDSAGKPTQIRYPSGRVLTLSYEQGELRSLSLAMDAGSAPIQVIDGIAWTAWSGLQRQAQWQSWTWSAIGQLHQRQFDDWGRLVSHSLGPWQRSLRYDDADRIEAYLHTDALGAAVPALDQGFGYDTNSRLNSAQLGLRQWTYGYDKNGNRISRGGSAGPGTQLIASTSNRLNSTTNPATSWGYDAQGNASTATPWKASYDVTGQMSRLDLGPTITQYGYDPDRRRVLKAVSLGAMTSFVYGQRGELLGEYDLASGEVIREYLWVMDTPVAMVGKAAGSPTAEIFAIHTDHLDTPRLLVDSLGRMRWSWLAEPYGDEAANIQPTAGLAAVNQPLRMPGQYWDAESGLFYNHHRYYDPRVGRYTQSDPIGLTGGINTYSYVGGNPVSRTDPDGRIFFVAFMGPSIGAGAADLAIIAAAWWATQSAIRKPKPSPYPEAANDEKFGDCPPPCDELRKQLDKTYISLLRVQVDPRIDPLVKTQMEWQFRKSVKQYEKICGPYRSPVSAPPEPPADKVHDIYGR